MADVIQVRRDTAANWTSSNPTLHQGEKGLETDTGKEKTGDGVTAWNSLGYSLLPISSLPTPNKIAVWNSYGSLYPGESVYFETAPTTIGIFDGTSTDWFAEVTIEYTSGAFPSGWVLSKYVLAIRNGSLKIAYLGGMRDDSAQFSITGTSPNFALSFTPISGTYYGFSYVSKRRL